jgi:hypothetical protein
MAKARDTATADLFEFPRPPAPAPGSLSCAAEIAHTMSEALRRVDADRYEIAARMSRLLGAEVSVHMLNAYTAESREAHNISLERAIAFDAATGGQALLDLHAAKLGASVNLGEQALVARLGEISRERERLAAQEKALRAFLGRSRP